MAADDPVTFTRGAADRIASAVRKVEIGSRTGGQVESDRVYDDTPVFGKKIFRVCTFTGAWSIGSSNTVTFKNQTTTPNTLTATNLFLPVPDDGTAAKDCAVAKDGTVWYLLQVKWDSADVLSNATLGTAALEFARVKSVSLGTASTVQISITTCSTAAS